MGKPGNVLSLKASVNDSLLTEKGLVYLYKKTIQRLGAVLCAVGVLCWTSLLLLTTFAAGGNSNLIIECKTMWGEILPGEQWSIYKVAEMQGDGTYALCGAFAEYPVSLEDVSASGLSEAAESLENYAVLDKVAPLSSGISDEDGCLYFSALDDGLYLLLGKTVEKDDVTYIPSPFLANISYDGNGEDMDVYAYPKYQVMSLESDSAEYTVVKEWGNAASEPKDPDAFVTVEIYRNGELHETVQLSSANNWSYSWNADGCINWRVKEIDVPEDCTVKYNANITILTITNTVTKVLPEPSETMPTTPVGTPSTTAATTETRTSTTTATTVTTVTTTTEKLPQTGQLWWPIPILAMSGLFFMSIGLLLRSKGRE